MEDIKKTTRRIKSCFPKKETEYYEDEQVGTDENGKMIYRKVKKQF